MKQKVIICGAGRVGTSIAEHLSNEGFDITVIDSNSEAIQKITELYDVQGVLGLASYPNVLEDAGITRDQEDAFESDSLISQDDTLDLDEEEISHSSSSLEELEKQLQDALENEDYELASKLRDEIKKRDL